jgi:CHAT domain-containing protein/tetratricopeptide (TPR) repeat protein
MTWSHPNRFGRLLLSFLAALSVLAVLVATPGHAPSQGLSEGERARRLAEIERDRKDAVSFANSGRLEEAAATTRKILAVEREVLGELHEDVLMSLQFLARVYEMRGDWVEARDALGQVLAIRQRRPEQREWQITDARRALDDLERRAAMRPDQRQRLGRADALNQTFLALLQQGKYETAKVAEAEALSIRREILGERHLDYATSLNNLAYLYQSMGDCARAEPLFRRALEITKMALGENHPDYATSLNNLAYLYQSMGDYARAEPLYRQALEITKKALGENQSLYATSLKNLAELYRSMGDYARADPLLRQSLEIMKKVRGENHPEYATTLNHLAGLYASRGDHGRAAPLFHQALEIRKKVLGETHPDYTKSLNSLATLYRFLGDHTQARLLLSDSLARSEPFLQDTASVLGERQRLRFLAENRGTLDAYLSVSPTDGSRSVDLYRLILAWKGAVEAEQLEDRLVRDQPELQPTLAQLAGVRARLAHLAFAVPAAAGRGAWRQQLDALREQKENLEADLARQSTSFRRQQQSRRLGPEELSAALPEGIALVDLFVYVQYSPPEGGKGELQREARLMAFVPRAGRSLAVVPLGTILPIDTAVLAWRRALEAHDANARNTAAAELRRRVWEPLQSHLAGVRTVLIAPDGALAWFPFAALLGSRPGSYLVEDLAIGYVSSGRQAAAMLAEPAGPAGRGLLAAGAIDFQADPGPAVPVPADRPAIAPAPLRVVAHRGEFRALPETGPEAQAARDLFHAAFADQPAEVLTGALPTEAALKRRLDGGRWRVVHLATHGFFESPARIAALRAAIRREDPLALSLPAGKDQQDDLAFALTPLLRSGLVLAGGGRDPGAAPADVSAEAPPREDGILTAEEVQALDLRGCELVVLSACETGLGQAEAGQGVLGLQRAFQAAGARAVVASLWKVDDAATAVLMKQFYTNLWTRKLPRLEALRQAQIAVLNNPGMVEQQRALGPKPEKLPEGGRPALPSGTAGRSDPALWAAFVLGGDGR